jgi:CRISPR/Cas system Type II protein with McrA/HNH and RuvC-like nuclease domain
VSGAARRHSKRWTVFKRDRGLCHYCGRFTPFTTTSGPGTGTVDHIVPLRLGGAKANDNLVWACSECNHDKDDTLPACTCRLCDAALRVALTLLPAPPPDPGFTPGDG